MLQVYFNPTQDGIFFEAAHGWGEGGAGRKTKKAPPPQNLSHIS